MTSLVVDLRDPELERLGVSGGDYRPVKVTVATSRVVRLTGGGFLFDGAPAVKWATTSAAVTFTIPATDGAEILASDRSTFEYVVTVEVDPPGHGKGREPKQVTFRGLLPTSLGGSVSAAQLMDPPGPLTLSQYQELDQRVDTLEASGGGSHTHSADDITSGTLGIARIPTGATASTVARGDHNTHVTPLVATGTDADSLRTTGTYFFANAAAADAASHLPTNLGGHLVTTGYATYCVQRYAQYNADNVWERFWNAVTWSAWVQTRAAGISTAATLPDSSTSAKGAVELATTAETTTGTDTVRAVTPAGVKAVADTKANTSHTHPASDLTATGTRDATTFLRGDNTWAVPVGGGTDPWSHAVATVDTTNSTTTAANATGLTIPALANGLYEFRIFVIVTSSVTTVGAQVGLAVTGSGSVVTAYGVGNNGATGSVSAFPGSAQLPMTVASLNAATGSSQMVGAVIEGTIRASSMTGSVDVTIKSETAGSAVAVKADSFLRYRRIAD